MPASSDDEIILRPATDTDGRQSYRTTLTPSSDPRVKVLLAKLPAVIPVVFLPGIMGTNLKRRSDNTSVWRPPNASFSVADILGIVGALLNWGFKDEKERQELLKGEDLTVDDRGSIDVGKSGLSKKTARHRGWGSVSRTSYNPIMALLQQRLNAISSMGNALEWWDQEGKHATADYGDEKSNPALTQDDLIQASRYSYDVWCCGYNWLNSNRQSGQDVIDYIENVVLKHYDEEGTPAKKVILVTHSMGGMVARAVSELHGYDKVLGVIHGVQPATGAPAIYHHMRCGYEGAVRFVLGRNAAQVTAVCANSAGALELVPTFDHRQGGAWLFARDAEGQDTLRLPATGNPYEEIYRSAEWHGLVPRQNEKYLDLSGNTSNSDAEMNMRAAFDERIGKTEEFHHAFSAKYHTHTYAHYGADDSDKMHSWRDIVWQGDASLLTIADALPEDDGRGSYRNRRMPKGPKLTAVAGAGDGTVCSYSGEAPSLAGVKASFRHSALGSGQHNQPHPGYDHQGSYNDKANRAQWATLYGIAKIAQEADWHPEDE